MTVGSLVRLKVKCLGNEPGTLGVCYSVDHTLGRPSYGIVFPNGEYDGFSPAEMGSFLEPAGFSSSVQDYQFTNVIRLSEDCRRGVFNIALQRR